MGVRALLHKVGAPVWFLAAGSLVMGGGFAGTAVYGHTESAPAPHPSYAPGHSQTASVGGIGVVTGQSQPNHGGIQGSAASPEIHANHGVYAETQTIGAAGSANPEIPPPAAGTNHLNPGGRPGSGE